MYWFFQSRENILHSYFCNINKRGASKTWQRRSPLAYTFLLYTTINENEIHERTVRKNAIKYYYRFIRAAIDRWRALLSHVLPVVMQFPPFLG